MGAMQRGVEVTFSRHDVEKLLLEFCWTDRGVLGKALRFRRSIHEVVVRGRVGRLLLELCEEEVVAPSRVTRALDGRCAIVTTELLFPLFPDFGIRRLWTSPCFTVEDATEGRLEFDLPSDTDVVKEKGVDDFGIGECPRLKLDSVFRSK